MSVADLRRVLAAVLWLSLVAAGTAHAVAPEEYGMLPQVRLVSISPDGKHYAFIQQLDDKEVFVLVDAKTHEPVGGVGSLLPARAVFFATNRHIIFIVSDTRRSPYVRGAWEQNGVLVYNLDTQEMTAVPKGLKFLYPAQSGFGRVVGVNAAAEEVYMPAFIGRPPQPPRMNLLRVNLNTAVAKIHAKGSRDTLDWFVDSQGNVLAREDFDEQRNLHALKRPSGRNWQTVYQVETEFPYLSFNALTPDATSLVFTDNNDDGNAVYQIKLDDGSVSGPHFQEKGRDVSLLNAPLSRTLMGTYISGALPRANFFNEDLNAALQKMAAHFPSSTVTLTSATKDLSSLVFRVSGNEAADDFFVLNQASNQVSRIGRGYPELSEEHIARVTAIRYSARDGEKIPAILTWPLGQEKGQGLPLIALPHGGPEAYDHIRFDWWAQYLARLGYLVLQPNFRGSSGYGAEFLLSGRGEWGRLMQDDITDGVDALIDVGYADPNRVCIMGASYGGYAALAGGAYTPEKYRCVISVNGVSDLPMMLSSEKRTHGSRHWVVKYWEALIGDSKAEREKLKGVSPAHAADRFAAPVLLIHGRDDSVVPIQQSQRMHRRLKRAGKPVELIELDGEDHWLSSSETRLAMLRAIDQFLRAHNPVDETTKAAAG